MTHLTPTELIDLVDGTLAPPRHAHLAQCERCQADAAELMSVLAETQRAEVPEPSPLFWKQLSGRVRASIDADVATPRTARWFEWPVLVPVGALALLVMALTTLVPQGREGVLRSQLAIGTAGASLDAAEDLEERWAAMFALVDELGLDSALDEGLLARPWSADGAVLQLTSSEQQELVRLLHEELR